jgi:hypothetical protein
VRVRLFELRLLAVALTIVWGVGGFIVLLAYRPGGPIDLLVGVAALLPLLVSVASVVWPPLVRGYGGLAAVFWLGLGAGLLLIPAIIDVAAQIQDGGTEPLLPSLERVYPWTLALLATSLFTGLGVTRRLYAENGLGQRRVASSVAFALAATGVIGGIFAGVSLADDAALRQQPPTSSRFGPTSPDVVLPECDQSVAMARSARVELELWADIDGHGIGSVGLSGLRSEADLEWTATISGGIQPGRRGAVRLGSDAWSLDPSGSWLSVAPDSVSDSIPDRGLVELALSPANRATAEDHGLEVVEGARARHCRAAVDGAILKAAVPQVAWLTGTPTLKTWRGEIDFWIFGDGEIGKAVGRVNGIATGVGEGLQATIRMSFTATNRDTPVSISPPPTSSAPTDLP